MAEKTLSDKPHLMYIASQHGRASRALALLEDSYEVTHARNLEEALDALSTGDFPAVMIDRQDLVGPGGIGQLLQSREVLEGMPIGVAVLTESNRIEWCNQRLLQWSCLDEPVGANFYALLGGPEIVGPDFCPFHTALATGGPTSSTLRTDAGQYFQIQTTPMSISAQAPARLIVLVRDTTAEVTQQQKMAAIHRAGVELADLTPDELAEMSVEDRVNLLKSNILHYTTDLLDYEFVEIRLLNQQTRRLDSVLSLGMDSDAPGRELYADVEGQGVTGFVAATGKSYLCEDTTEDPLYISGAPGAKSSLTVPLVLHDQVVGTFNVESPKPRAFSESDLQFLEIFGHNVAAALNQLNLLAAEQATATAQSCEAIHREVALPIDEILTDTVKVIESQGEGTDPEVVARLRDILKNAREIKGIIQRVGESMRPTGAYPSAPEERPEEKSPLAGRRILVVDADEHVRSAAHAMLACHGCDVETAHDGAEALGLIRTTADPYNMVISDLYLPDQSGYEFMLALKALHDGIPVVLMTGFGYDPGHIIVKARKLGMKHVLYKPFRLDQLLTTIEQTLGEPQTADQA